MSESKIKSIQANGTYEGAYGLMYKFEVTLEDGVTGEVSTKSESRWNEGDEVEYTATDTQWGKRLKLSKPGMDGGRPSGGGNRQSPEVQKRIDGSWAVGQAIQMLGNIEVMTVETLGEYLQQAESVARKLLDVRNKISND